MYLSLNFLAIMEQQYLDLIEKVLTQGKMRKTRNGNVLSVFGASIECSLEEGFPLLTTKKMFFKGIVEELAWFLRGSTNVQELRDKRVHIWDGNSETKDYDAGPVYGFQWRHFGADYSNCHGDYSGKGVDQIKKIIDLINDDPHSRRMVLSAWCPTQQDQMCLPPCHVMYQFYIEHDNKVSVQMTQRSSDIFLGLPFNIASTALLVHLIAHQCGKTPGRVIIRIGDAHIYEEHIKACITQLTRTPKSLPSIQIQRTNEDGLWNVKRSEIKLNNYSPEPRIQAQMKP